MSLPTPRSGGAPSGLGARHTPAARRVRPSGPSGSVRRRLYVRLTWPGPGEGPGLQCCGREARRAAFRSSPRSRRRCPHRAPAPPPTRSQRSGATARGSGRPRRGPRHAATSPPVAPIAGALAERLGDDPNALRTGVSAAREAKAGAAGLRPLAGSLRLLARRPKPPAGSVADRGLGAEALDRLADPQERLLELPGALEVGVPELGPELVHAEAEQELLGGLLVDPLRLGAGVELGEEAQRLALDGRAVDQVRAHRAARLVVEVVRRQLGEDRDEARVRDDAGERGPLAADRGGHAPRREGGLGRADARELR